MRFEVRLLALFLMCVGFACTAAERPERLTISFWIWALYDDPARYDENLAAMKERGFNCVRIDDAAGFYAAPDGTPRGEIALRPPFGRFSHDMRQMIIDTERTCDPRKRLVAFCRAAARQDIRVILSCWYYIHTNWMVDESINRQLFEGLSLEGKFAYFADELNRALAVLRENGLERTVAFAELFNEFDGLPFTAKYRRLENVEEAHLYRDLHEKALARLKAANPGVKFAYDAASMQIQKELVPRNADILNFHSYYAWSVYGAFEHGGVKGTVEEIPIPEATRKYLIPEPHTIAEVVATRRGNLRVSNDWNARVRLYASIDDAKIPELEKDMMVALEKNYDRYLAALRSGVKEVFKVRDEVLPGVPVVMGEGVTYCASNRLLFEEHSDLYWKMLREQAKILREAGLWGTVPRTTSGPEDPGWRLRAADLKAVNEAFTRKE